MNTSNQQGLLIMAANALGLTDDIPQRSLEAVRQAEMLIFEEDKPARLVLKTAGVHRDYYKYNEQTQAGTLEVLEETLKRGETVVYMSDQGCPTLEDPGREVINTARRCKAKIKVIPGPSSVTSALSACPFPTQAFEFNGFPPRDEYKRNIFLKKFVGRRKLQIFMDTPYRLKHVLASCAEIFPAKVEGFVALDITGPDEDYWCAPFKELLQQAEELNKKLNFVLIINPIIEHEEKQLQDDQYRYKKKKKYDGEDYTPRDRSTEKIKMKRNKKRY